MVVGRIGSRNNDARTIRIERARGGIDVVERDSAQQVRHAHVEVEAQAEHLGTLKKIGDARVGLERARHRANEVTAATRSSSLLGDAVPPQAGQLFVDRR